MSRKVNEQFATWLRHAMNRAGYPTEGPRAGGSSRLAEDAGVSMPTISRLINEGRTPEIDTLRRLAKPLRQSFRTLLIEAGYFTAEELPVDEAARQVDVRAAILDSDEIDERDKRVLLASIDEMTRPHHDGANGTPRPTTGRPHRVG